MNNKVYIRVDGSAMIGLGHLVRCTAFAHMLKDHFDIVFVCKEIPGSLREVLNSNQFALENISEEDIFFNKLKSKDIVVLDGYDFGTVYQRQIKQIGCKLVCIDDLHNMEFVADLIINHAPGIVSADYKTQDNTRFALGTSYALLRPAFLKQAKNIRVIERVETVLICFGGSDNKNLTERALDAVRNFGAFKRIIVITGSEFSYLNSLNRSIHDDNRVSHYHAVNEQQLLELMLVSDLAIVPSSVILFEALAAGCKVISGYYVDNQKEIYNGFLSLNSFIDAGDFDSVCLINSLKKANEHSTIRIFDGESSGRLLKCIKNLNNVSSNIS